jgi:hypothetical protein
VFAVVDRDGSVWWATPAAGAPVFECSVGDRFLHIDELGCVDIRYRLPSGEPQSRLKGTDHP